MKQVSHGWWVPDEDPDYLAKVESVNGIPLYQVDRLAKSVEACNRGMRHALDLGANTGIWTAHLAKYFQRVTAIEAIWDCLECLDRNLSEHVPDVKSKVSSILTCLSDVDAQDAVLRTGGSSMSWTGSDAKDEPATFTAKCFTSTVDSFEFTDVDLIKIDVEGMEAKVLRGAEETILKYRPVIIVELKFDKDDEAAKLLSEWGMVNVWKKKHDYLWKFPN